MADLKAYGCREVEFRVRVKSEKQKLAGFRTKNARGGRPADILVWRGFPSCIQFASISVSRIRAPCVTISDGAGRTLVTITTM